MPFTSGFIIFVYILFSFELVLDAIVLAISCLNLAVICSSKILPDNLKNILIAQSVAILHFGIVRAVMIAMKLFSDQTLAVSGALISAIMNFNMIFRRLLGHVLIVDRFVATVYPNSNEKFTKRYFTLAWIMITFFIAFVNAMTYEQTTKTSMFNCITSILSMVLSFFEYTCISIIGYYNQKIYKKQIEKATPSNYYIGLRYRISVNIHTAKQLSGTFLCFFLSNLFLSVIYSAIAFNIVNKPYQISLIYMASNWSNAILCVATELTIMTHHPLLKRRLANLLKKIFCFKFKWMNRVQTFADQSVNNGTEKSEHEMNEHFKMLNKLWN